MYKYNPKTACQAHYNPKVDREAVDQVGFIDLRKSYESGSIPGNATFLDERCNGIADPDDIMDRPKDNFERMRQRDYVINTLKSVKAAEADAKQSTETGGNN